MPNLITIEDFAVQEKLTVKQAKRVISKHADLGVKIAGFRSKRVNLDTWNKITKRAVNGN